MCIAKLDKKKQMPNLWLDVSDKELWHKVSRQFLLYVGLNNPTYNLTQTYTTKHETNDKKRTKSAITKQTTKRHKEKLAGVYCF